MRRLRPLVIAILILLVSAPAVAADASGSCSTALPTRPNATWLSDAITSASDVDWFKFSLASSRYVLITLGALPANYRLDLYKPCSTLIASSNRSGTTYEEMYRNLVAGTYYVKVSSSSGASSATTYRLKFRPLTVGLQIPSSRAWIDAGYLHVAGEVLNNTSARKEFVEVVATYYNSSGQVIGTDFTFTLLDILGSRTRAPFHLISTLPGGYDHYRLSVSGDPPTDSAIGNLAISPGVPYTDGVGYRHYPGQVTNHNGFSVQFTEVLVTLYDNLGRVLNTEFSFTNPDTIGAGGTAPYDVTFADHYSGTNRYVTQVQASA